MVNGAGLAMATMDIIKLHGGSPANFLGKLWFNSKLFSVFMFLFFVNLALTYNINTLKIVVLML